MLHAKALDGNPFDGHTLGPVIAELEALTGIRNLPNPCRQRLPRPQPCTDIPRLDQRQVCRVIAPIRHEMRRRPSSGTSRPSIQCLVQIRDQVVGILNPDRNANKRRRDTQPQPFFFRNVRMRHRRRMRSKSLRTTQAHCELDHLQLIQDSKGFGLTSLHFEAESGAWALALALEDWPIGFVFGGVIGLFAGYLSKPIESDGLGLSAVALLAGYNITSRPSRICSRISQRGSSGQASGMRKLRGRRRPPRANVTEPLGNRRRVAQQIISSAPSCREKTGRSR